MTPNTALLTICLVLVAAWPLTAAYQYVKKEMT
jgi:hypothetical protein